MSRLKDGSLKKKNILITGITGFVGENLTKYLIEDFDLEGVSRNKAKKMMSYEDVDEQKLSIANAFIHLAGKAHDLKNTSEEKEYFRVNTELTKELFNTFLMSKCETFIFMSSVKAVADEIEGELTEEHQSNPITAYGKSKLAAEEYILNNMNIPECKRVYILRPCMIHGPGNKGNLNLLYAFISKGIPYPFGRYGNRRSFLSVHNLCFIIKELIENENIPSGVYNVADDIPLSTKQVVINIAEVINKKILILNIPKFLIFFLGKLGDILPLPFNSEKIQKLTESYRVSNQKIKDVIGIKQLPLTSKEGITLTIKSFVK